MRASISAAVVSVALALVGVAHAQPVDRPGADDALHFGVSAGLAAGGYAFGAVLFDDVPPRIGLGVGIALVAGALKELLDLAGLGTPSWSDVAWDAAGIFVGVVVAWIVDELFFHGARAAHTAGSASIALQPGQAARPASHHVRIRSSGSSVPR